jgi:predicted nuclease of predicted toxin-antitoxin system
MTTARFYPDENVQVAVADQLRRHNVDVVTARELNMLGASDLAHLKTATTAGRVLCTHDSDFVVLAMHGTDHAGIVLGKANVHRIGDWVRALLLIHGIYGAEEMQK